MTRILLVDDAAALTVLFADALHERCSWDVDVCVAVGDVELLLRGDPYDLALVDLSFPQETVSGLDALAQIHSSSPTTKLAIITQGDVWVSDILIDAWELLPIVTVVSKSAPLDYQIDMISGVLAGEVVPVDPAIQPLLPKFPNSRRNAERFSHLVEHRGHAKLWNVLMDRAFDATYKNVAESTGLKLNTIKNYRTQLLAELRVHGLDDPSLREMQKFGLRCGCFLRPVVERSLNNC